MTVQVRLYNPSPYKRTGHVTVAWEACRERLGFDDDQVVVRDAAGHVLASQIDPVFPGRGTLSFTLAESLPPVGRDDYDDAHPAGKATIERGHEGAWKESQAPQPIVDAIPDDAGKLRGVKLYNGSLDVWINLLSAPWEPERGWFAGSATSVVVGNGDGRHESLDALDWFHDAEKRVLQPDRLVLPCAAWHHGDQQEARLFDEPYDLVAQNAGPVRATATLASAPFEYLYTDLGSKDERRLTCRLYRVLSLYRGADHVIEELFVQGDHAEPAELTFAAHYFSYMRMRGGLRVSQFAQVPDWFAVTSGLLAVNRKFHCYGFATDAHAGPVEHPCPDYPVPDNAGNSLAWSLRPCKKAKNLHLFTFWRPEDRDWPPGGDFFAGEEKVAHAAQRASESRAGRAWYEFIYKPLKARF